MPNLRKLRHDKDDDAVDAVAARVVATIEVPATADPSVITQVVRIQIEVLSVPGEPRSPDVNTLLLQRILADQPFALTVEDRQALSPLFWTHVRPYGTFQLHLDRHLDLDPHPISA